MMEILLFAITVFAVTIINAVYYWLTWILFTEKEYILSSLVGIFSLYCTYHVIKGWSLLVAIAIDAVNMDKKKGA